MEKKGRKSKQTKKLKQPNFLAINPHSRPSTPQNEQNLDDSSLLISTLGSYQHINISRKVRMISKESATLKLKARDIKLQRSKPILQTDIYTIYPARCPKTDQNFVAKIYKKSKIFSLDLTLNISSEILVHENSKDSSNILKIIASYETSEELVIIFEKFEKMLNLANLATDRAQQVLLAQVLLALIEINSFSYSVLHLEALNVVKMGNSDYKLFNFNHLAKFSKSIKNVKTYLQHKNVDPEIAPEVLGMSRIGKKTDSWTLGVFLSKVISRANRGNQRPDLGSPGQINFRKLAYHPRSELLRLFEHKFHCSLITDLAVDLLKHKDCERVELVRVMQNDYFKTVLGSLEVKNFIHPFLVKISNLIISGQKQGSGRRRGIDRSKTVSPKLVIPVSGAENEDGKTSKIETVFSRKSTNLAESRASKTPRHGRLKGIGGIRLLKVSRKRLNSINQNFGVSKSKTHGLFLGSSKGRGERKYSKTSPEKRKSCSKTPKKIQNLKISKTSKNGQKIKSLARLDTDFTNESTRNNQHRIKTGEELQSRKSGNFFGSENFLEKRRKTRKKGSQRKQRSSKTPEKLKYEEIRGQGRLKRCKILDEVDDDLRDPRGHQTALQRHPVPPGNFFGYISYGIGKLLGCYEA